MKLTSNHHPMRSWAVTLLAMLISVWLAAGPAAAAKELAVEDFKFDGPLGSHGATIERIGENR